MATTSYKSSSADSYSHNIVHPALKADLYRIQNAISIRTKTPSHEPSSHNPRQRPERAKLELVQVGHGPSGTYIATACSTDHVIIRKSRKGCAPLYRTIKLSRNRLQKLVAMDFSPRAKFLVCAMLDGTIHLRSTAHIFGDDRQNSSDCEKGPLTDSPSSSKQGGTLRQSRPFRGARRRRRLHRVSLTSMVSAAVSERSTESNEDGGISSSSTFPYYYSDAFATDTHPLYQYGGGGERAGGSSSALGSSGLNTAAGLGSREWRRNIFADEPGQESFQVENTSSPISVCKWWTSASGQDYLLIGRNDGTLTFLNLATRTMNTVRRTSRSVTIAAMWIAPLLPAGSVALILSLDGGYHLLPLEQVEEGRVGTHTSMSSSMGLAAAFGDHGALGAVGRGGGISAGYFPSSSINQQDKVGMMDTEKMGRRSTVTRHTEWIAQNSRAHRFRPISLNALSTTPSSSFKTSVRFSIQWCESSRGQTATYGYSRTRRVGIQHRACLAGHDIAGGILRLYSIEDVLNDQVAQAAATLPTPFRGYYVVPNCSHAQIVGKLIVCYSDTAAVASTSSPTVAAKRRARSSFRPYQSSSGPSSSSQPTERPRVYILSASLAKVPPLASEKMNHHHHHHHHHARSSGGGSSSGSSFVYQQQHLRKTSGSASSASATRKKKKKKKKKKGGGGFFDSKGGYSWRTALVQELCLDATRSEGSKRKRTARSTAGSPPSPSTSASSNDSKRMFSEVIFATNPPPVAAYFSYTPPRAGDINTGGGGGGGGREPPSAARKRRGVVGGHKGGGEASGARRINLRGGHQFNTGNASGSTRKRQNDYNSNNSSSSTDSILQEVFLWRGGSLVQHLTWKENESKNLRNHLRTPPPCPSSGWAEWWQEAKRLWWSGMCCGIDVQSLCEQQADKMFARFETRQAALEVYKLSRAPLPKRVGQHLLQRDSVGLLQLAAPQVSGSSIIVGSSSTSSISMPAAVSSSSASDVASLSSASSSSSLLPHALPPPSHCNSNSYNHPSLPPKGRGGAEGGIMLDDDPISHHHEQQLRRKTRLLTMPSHSSRKSKHSLTFQDYYQYYYGSYGDSTISSLPHRGRYSSPQLPEPPSLPATARQLNCLSDLVIQCYVHQMTLTPSSPFPSLSLYSTNHFYQQLATAAEEEEEGGGGEGGTDTPMKILLQNQYLYLEGFAGGVGSSSGSYYSSKQVEEDLYRFVNANHLYSCKRAVAALISQLPSDFGLGAALEIARCREQKRICIARMAQKAVLDLSPSDFGSLISKDYTSLVLHTTEGGAIFRSLPAHQKFQMIQMQLSEWEDRENDLLFSSSPSGVASSGKSNSIDEDRRGGGHGGKRKTNRAGAAPPPSSSSPAGKSSSASRAMGRQNKGRNARKYNGQYDAKKESSSAAGDLLHRTTRTRPLLCAFGDYVRVLWTLVAALDQAWLSRLADFLNPSFTANKKRFRGSGLEGEITTLFLVTLLRLQHLRWKDAVSEEEEEEQVRERRNLDSQLLLDHHHHHHHHHIDGIVDEDDDDGQNARLQYQQGQEILEAHIRRRIDEYDNATVLYRALDWENYEAASVIYEAQQRWPEAIECRLHSQRTSDATVLKWVETKVRKMTRTQQARILPLVLRYWASRELPVEPLENCLLSIFPDIAMSLGHVLINGEGVCLDAEKQRRLGMTSGANSSRKILFEIPHFSWRLYTQLVNYGIRNL